MARIFHLIAVPLLMAAAAARLPSAGAFEQEILEAHNLVREGVPVPPLEWSAKLAEAAKKWADHLLSSGRFEHQTHNVCGENLFEAKGGPVSATGVVAAWAAESANYDYRENTCLGKCGHYTQIVWHSSREVGCADARAGRRQVVVCEYSPAGNWVGERPW